MNHKMNNTIALFNNEARVNLPIINDYMLKGKAENGGGSLVKIF